MLAGATSLEYLRLFKVHVCVPVKEHFEHVHQLVANKILSCAKCDHAMWITVDENCHLNSQSMKLRMRSFHCFIRKLR